MVQVAAGPVLTGNSLHWRFPHALLENAHRVSAGFKSVPREEAE